MTTRRSCQHLGCTYSISLQIDRIRHAAEFVHPTRSSYSTASHGRPASSSPRRSTTTSSSSTTPAAATQPLACSPQPNTKTATSTPTTPPDSRNPTPENRGQITLSTKAGEFQCAGPSLPLHSWPAASLRPTVFEVGATLVELPLLHASRGYRNKRAVLRASRAVWIPTGTSVCSEGLHECRTGSS